MVNEKNIIISSMLYELAGLKELDGANQYQVAAYKYAADWCKKYNGDVLDVTRVKIPGIGESLTSKIVEAYNTGKITQLEELRSKYPVLTDLMLIPSVGQKRAHKLWLTYRVKTREELKSKPIDARLREALEFSLINQRTYAIATVVSLTEPLLMALRAVTERVEVAGSVRRQKPTVKDVDIVATNENVIETINQFKRFGKVFTGESSDKKCSIFLYGSIQFQIDLRLFDKSCFGSAMNYFTGSKEHNVRLRSMAKNIGLLVNEYGIFKDGVKIGGEKEEDLYNILNIPYIEPKDRIK